MKFIATLFVNDRPVAAAETAADGSAAILVPRGVSGHKDNSVVIVRDQNGKLFRSVGVPTNFCETDTVNIGPMQL